MNNTRRQFLKVASLSLLGIAGNGLFPGVSQARDNNTPSFRSAEKELTAKRWAMVIDTRKFTTRASFEKVIQACHHYHNVPTINSKQEVKWLWRDGFRQTFTDESEEGAFTADDVLNRQYLMLCNHCENPACIRVCPTQATFKRKDGIVVMDYHRCIGCRYCMAGCPYGARSFNFMDPRPYIDEINPRFPTRMRGVVEKCTFCSERLSEGKLPLCVEASDGAIIFGDISDPESAVRKVLSSNYTIRRKQTLGTGPNVYYII